MCGLGRVIGACMATVAVWALLCGASGASGVQVSNSGSSWAKPATECASGCHVVVSGVDGSDPQTVPGSEGAAHPTIWGDRVAW